MNILNIILQAQTAQGGGGFSFIFMMLAVFAVMYFFMIRPQRKQQKEMEQFRKNLKKGDRVVTAGGIFGTIAEANPDSPIVTLRVDTDVRIKVAKASLQKDFSEAEAPEAPSAKQ